MSWRVGPYTGLCGDKAWCWRSGRLLGPEQVPCHKYSRRQDSDGAWECKFQMLSPPNFPDSWSPKLYSPNCFCKAWGGKAQQEQAQLSLSSSFAWWMAAPKRLKGAGLLSSMRTTFLYWDSTTDNIKSKFGLYCYWWSCKMWSWHISGTIVGVFCIEPSCHIVVKSCFRI